MGGVNQTEFQLPTERVTSFVTDLCRDGCSELPSFDPVTAEGVLDIKRSEMNDKRFILAFWPPKPNETARQAELHWWPLRVGDDKQFGTRLALRVSEIAVQHGATITWESPYK